ncbi:transcriptional regulator [Paractinoplanes deccanensis]|uniref:Transcriptional regulator n=1 Tax=Paractinoplanes deccanensis TaxID=113561 RepID=A0ABQ3YCQ6_9ACTN|nr:winged helix-turn-helix domain-containing protein [Actinoplanes deccanensis]GID77772.1 transcriptional regulator [Actinoplanes deccanensis]
MTDGQSRRISEPQVMRALAHPARIEIMEYLNNTGAAITATECAELVGLSPSATSYHLRELAKYKLVEQAPSRGDGRERVWRSTSTGLRIDTEGGEPEAVAAAAALVDVFLDRDVRRAREWVRRQPNEPEPWRDAGGMSSLELLLTADELKELTAKVNALTEPYRLRDRQETAPPTARRVHFNYVVFPTEEGQP